MLTLLLLTGCATRSTALRHSETGELQNCQASGWGWLGAPAALIMHSNCMKRMKEAGYVEGVGSLPPNTQPPPASNPAPVKHIPTTTVTTYSSLIPSPPDGKEWNLNIAKSELKAGRIHSDQYEKIVNQLNWELNQKIAKAKSDLRNGQISNVEYDKRVKEAKLEYRG